ncbi:MAG: hypothetical protein GX914_02410 [Erysipelotrichia bacterium]|nr:hypothetical protein [Erysipelotrichia bacterium]
MPLEIITGSIVEQKTDIIVSCNNSKMIAVGGNSLAIFNKIGYRKAKKLTKDYRNLKTAEIAVTSGFDLCQKIIHVVSPIYDESSDNNEELLFAAYNNVLNKAKELFANSISFPLLSADGNNYPKQLALDIAIKAIGSFIKDNEIDVKLVLLPEEKSNEVKYPELHRLINEAKTEKEEKRDFKAASHRLGMMVAGDLAKEAFDFCEYQEADLEDYLDKMDISFSKTVLKLIDEKGYTDSEVYKRANLDRRVFSKLRSSDDYQPSKTTAIALAFALKLSASQTDDLLLKAGYSLSKSNIADIIVRYCLNSEIYDIYEVNETLFKYNQKQLGSL